MFFKLTPVSVPILGADFRRLHNLLLDVTNQKVFSSPSPSMRLTSSPQPSSSLRATLLSNPKSISNLLSKFPGVLSSDGFTASLPRHQVCDYLLTHLGPTVFTKPFAWIQISFLLLRLSSPQ